MTVYNEMEMIRTLMLDIGNRHAHAEITGNELVVEGRDDETVSEHLRLLIAAEFVRGQDNNRPGAANSADVVVQGITWRGRQFVDASNNVLSWAKTKHYATRKGNKVSVAVLTDIAASIGMHAIAW